MLRQIFEKLVGGIAIGVFGAVALFAKVGDQPRLWDVLSERLSPAVAQNGPNVIWVDSQRPVTRMMVTGDSSFAPQTSAAAPTASPTAAVPTRAAVASDWRRHISGMLAMFNVSGPATEHSSASVSAASGAAAASSAPSSVAPAAGYASPAAVAAVNKPAIDASAQSYVSYGAGTRSDIMSSASGPVYNFGGGKR
jgi:hypothetical protein